MRSVSWIEQRMASMSQVWASFFERKGAAMEGRHGHQAARQKSADPCPHGQQGAGGAQYGQPDGAGAAYGQGAGAAKGGTGTGTGGASPGVQPGGLYMLDDSWEEVRDDGAAPLCLNASQQGTGELDAALMRPSYAFAEDGWVRFEVLSDQQLIDHCQGEIAVLLRSFQGNPEERALLLMPLIRMLVRQCGPLPVELTRCAMDRADMLRRSLRLANTALEVYGTLSASLVKSSTILKSLSAQAARQAQQSDADEDSEGGTEETYMDSSVSDSTSSGRARSRGRAPAAQTGAAAGGAAVSAADGADGADEEIEDSRNWRFLLWAVALKEPVRAAGYLKAISAPSLVLSAEIPLSLPCITAAGAQLLCLIMTNMRALFMRVTGRAGGTVPVMSSMICTMSSTTLFPYCTTVSFPAR